MWASAFTVVSSGRKGLGGTGRLRIGCLCLKVAAGEIHVRCGFYSVYGLKLPEASRYLGESRSLPSHSW